MADVEAAAISIGAPIGDLTGRQLLGRPRASNATNLCLSIRILETTRVYVYIVFFLQKNFMLIAADIIRRDAAQREAAERRRSSRRWSLIGIGAAALVGVGAIIGTRVLLGAK